MSLLSIFSISGSGMAAEGQRLQTVASNLANADSTVDAAGQPYRAREVVFSAASSVEGQSSPASTGMAGVRVAGVVESQEPLKQVYDPGNPYANAQGYVQMPNVNPVDEMVNMISATRNYQADLEAFNVAKTLALKTLAI